MECFDEIVGLESYSSRWYAHGGQETEVLDPKFNAIPKVLYQEDTLTFVARELSFNDYFIALVGLLSIPAIGYIIAIFNAFLQEWIGS